MKEEIRIAQTDKFQSRPMHRGISNAQGPQRGEEETQRELRSCDIVIYNVHEPENGNKTERAKCDKMRRSALICSAVCRPTLKVFVSQADVKK